MSHTPESNDESPRFDPRSEKFLESFRNLIEFKVRRENFDQNRVETHQLFSRSMTDAVDFAVNELEGDGWYIISITRICDDTFFASLPGTQTSEATEDDPFWEIVNDLITSDSATKSPDPE